MFTINVNHYYPETEKRLHRIERQLKRLTIQNLTIMATLEQVVAKVAELQETVDTEQAQIAAAIAALEQTVADLQAIIDGSITPEALDGVVASIDAVIADLASTIPDGTEPPAEEPEV